MQCTLYISETATVVFTFVTDKKQKNRAECYQMYKNQDIRL